MEKNIKELNDLMVNVKENIHNIELEIAKELEKGNTERVSYLTGMKDSLHYMEFKIGIANRGVQQ